MADDKIIDFRTRLIEDENFRAQFASSPREALSSVGIEVPENVELPSIDKDELDRRVASLQDNVPSELIDQLLAGQSELGDAQLEAVAGGRQQVYKISAYGTIDW